MDRETLRRALTPRLTEYTKIGLENKKQILFLLLLDPLEIFYGGAAGGGKSIAVLAGASQFLDVPGYAALVLRRRYRDLALPGALMAISKQWWTNSDARWSGPDHNWTFPSGAVVQFGYLEHEGDEEQYQSAAFQYIGFDELTHFTEKQYTYLFNRLRRPDDIERFPELKKVPLRMRGAGNPGSRGHMWVKKRWGIKMIGGEAVGTNTAERIFIPSKLGDNPYIDKPSYEKSLDQLTALTRKQLKDGDWNATSSGGVFDVSAIPITQTLPERKHWLASVRLWDLAATEPTEAEPDPDYTVGLKLIKTRVPPPSLIEEAQRRHFEIPAPPYWIVLDIKRGQKESNGVEKMVAEAAHIDGFHTPICILQERGGAGKLLPQSYSRHVVPGYTVLTHWAQGDKLSRAELVSPMTNKGRVFCYMDQAGSPWIEAFLDELGVFTGKPGIHDDQVDALSGAYQMLDKIERTLTQNTRVEQH